MRDIDGLDHATFRNGFEPFYQLRTAKRIRLRSSRILLDLKHGTRTLITYTVWRTEYWKCPSSPRQSIRRAYIHTSSRVSAWVHLDDLTSRPVGALPLTRSPVLKPRLNLRAHLYGSDQQRTLVCIPAARSVWAGRYKKKVGAMGGETAEVISFLPLGNRIKAVSKPDTAWDKSLIAT